MTSQSSGGPKDLIQVTFLPSQKDNFVGMLEQEIDAAAKLIDSRSWDDRVWAHERLSLVYSLMQQLGYSVQTSVLDEINLND